MRKITWLTCLFIAFSGVIQLAAAQITLDSTDVSSLFGNTYQISEFETSDTTGLRSIIEASGEGQTYDFTTINGFGSTSSGNISFMELPADIPGATDTTFRHANFAIAYDLSLAGSNTTTTDSTVYAYQQLTSTALKNVGFIIISQEDINNDGVSPDTVRSHFHPLQLNATFPLTFNSSWQDSSVFTFSFGSYSSSTITKTETMVDGWGTLKLPGGKTFDCLRLNTMTIDIDSSYGLPPYTTSTVTYDTTRSYDYITQTGWGTTASIEVDNQGNPMYAYYSIQSTGTAIEKDGQDAVVEGFRLKQNYPNPFNPSTVITYNLPVVSPVTLEIYNTSGQLISTLVNRTQNAGPHNVTFNAEGLNSGVYFYKLDAGSYSLTKKMLLIK